ncbi:MAG: acetylornithine/succinylornithine family transaminase [Erysipelotrichaceae bacterium]|nr:acetylornithine/succinylornithine family transaminase [Erysipelotrichaceae bacterium]
MDVKQMDATFIAHTYKRQPIVIASAKGSIAYDDHKKHYIDFTSGIGVNVLGYGYEEWANEIFAQAQTLSHCSNHYYQKPSVKTAQMLCEKTGAQKVFFSNSGAESNECAIKTARKYSYEKYGNERYEILTLQQSFHGRTITTLSATGQDAFHQFYHPFTNGFTYIKPNDIEDFYRKVNEKTCAIMLELIQGESGVFPLHQDYVRSISQYCHSHDLLLIIDEVQSGVGRCGSFCAYQQYDIHPDIVTLAKGLGAGLPIGATLFYETTQNVLHPGDHGSTFGANPIVCAGANVVLKCMNDTLYQHVKEMGNHITKRLKRFPHIQEVEGMGLMIGATIRDVTVQHLIADCLKKGLLLLNAKKRLRLLPPLNISKEHIEEGLSILHDVLRNL